MLKGFYERETTGIQENCLSIVWESPKNVQQLRKYAFLSVYHSLSSCPMFQWFLGGIPPCSDTPRGANWLDLSRICAASAPCLCPCLETCWWIDWGDRPQGLGFKASQIVSVQGRSGNDCTRLFHHVIEARPATSCHITRETMNCPEENGNAA